MTKEKVIFSKRFDHEFLNQSEEQPDESDFDDSEVNLPTAKEFVKFIEENRKAVPDKKRLAEKHKFLIAVSELSRQYEIDTDIYEADDGYTAYLYMRCASYCGYDKKLLTDILVLADDFSMFKSKDESCDIIMCFTYHTHHIFLNGRELTKFS